MERLSASELKTLESMLKMKHLEVLLKGSYAHHPSLELHDLDGVVTRIPINYNLRVTHDPEVGNPQSIS